MTIEIGCTAGSTSTPTVTVGPDFGNPPEAGVGVQLTMPALEAGYGQSVGISFSLFDVAPFHSSSVGAHLSGTALGAPLWQSVGSVTSSIAGSSVVIPKPADLAVGDLMVAFVGAAQLNTTTLPTGWTLILNTQRDGTNDVTLNSSWKIAEASDVAATSFTFTLASSAAFIGCIHRVSAVDSTTPINVSGGGSGSATDPVAPTITTTVDNCLKICACVQFNATNADYTPPSGYTERTDQNGLGALSAQTITGETATRAQATAGASGTATMDSTQAVASDYAAQHIAIAPGTITLAA